MVPKTEQNEIKLPENRADVDSGNSRRQAYKTRSNCEPSLKSSAAGVSSQN
jgi:hypothetical protein